MSVVKKKLQVAALQGHSTRQGDWLCIKQERDIMTKLPYSYADYIYCVLGYYVVLTISDSRVQFFE